MRFGHILIATGLFLASGVCFAQQGFNPYMPDRPSQKIKRSPIRAVLNKFSLMTTVGYGRTFYSVDWSDVSILDGNGQSILLENYTINGDDISYSGIRNWLNYPVSDTLGTASQTDGYRVVNADSVNPGYKGSGYNIPINISLHFDINRFRIGGGYTFDFHRVKKLTPKGGANFIYEPDFGMTTMRRWYILAGGKVYRWRGWDYFAELHVGKVKYGGGYDLASLSNGMYFNIGIPIEYEFSEYFWFFVRPSFEFKKYALSLPAQYADSNIPTSMSYKQPAVYVNFGFRFKFPEVRRCPVKSCQTQLKHVHGGREFRGQPIYKVQNPKIGENEHWRHKFNFLKGK